MQISFEIAIYAIIKNATFRINQTCFVFERENFLKKTEKFRHFDKEGN
jgi:hypothetical protein